MLQSQGIHHQATGGYFLPQRDRGPSKPKMPQGPQRPPKAEAKALVGFFPEKRWQQKPQL